MNIVLETINFIGAIVKTFEEGVGAILLENLRCSGVESSLIECSHSPLNVHNCDHSDDAGVRCNCEFIA